MSSVPMIQIQCKKNIHILSIYLYIERTGVDWLQNKGLITLFTAYCCTEADRICFI